VDILFKGLFHYETEMGTLGAVTIKIFAFIFMFLKGIREHGLGFFDLAADLRQVGQLQGCAVFGNKRPQIKSVEVKISIFNFNTFLWKIECLFDQVVIGICHGSKNRLSIEGQKYKFGQISGQKFSDLYKTHVSS
jgi:hypothetical protein